MDRIWSLKLVLLGESGVGKSTFMMKLVEDQAIHHRSATLRQTTDGSYLLTTVYYESGSIGLNITLVEDINPQRDDLKAFFKNASGAIVFYDVSKRDTNRVRYWIKEYLKYSYVTESPILIIGNKVDLISTKQEDNIFRTHRKLLTTLEHTYPNLSPIISTFTSLAHEDNIIEDFKRYLNHLIISVNLKYDMGDREMSSSFKEIHHLLPAVYIIGFHEKFGSVILNKLRHDGVKGTTDKEMNSSIKIVSVLDFDNVDQLGHVSASFPWTDPPGHCNYIAFTVKNEEARGGAALYVIAIVWDLSVKEYILEWGQIIEGYLQVGMDEFKEFIESIDSDFIREDDYNNHDYREEMDHICEDLRDHVLALIRQSMIKDT